VRCRKSSWFKKKKKSEEKGRWEEEKGRGRKKSLQDAARKNKLMNP